MARSLRRSIFVAAGRRATRGVIEMIGKNSEAVVLVVRHGSAFQMW